MINWDYMITYGGPELFVAFVVIFITPFFYWLILKRFKLAIKITGIFTLWVVAIFIAYWDVYQIAKEAERLCREEAGLHVYKTVEAEGVSGIHPTKAWFEYGFSYIENETILGGKKRYTLQNDVITEEEINSFRSHYKYSTDSEVLDMPFTRNKKIIQDQQSGEILGQITSFSIYPGWLDSRLLGLLGFTWIPPRCDGDYPPERGKTILYYDDLIRHIIKPANLENGETT